MNEDIEYRIKRVQAGEIQDYAYIVKEYQRQIFVYCWRLLGSEQEAEEAVQDIFVNAFEKISKYKPTVGFSSWLYKMAYHYCLNLIRRKNLQRKFKLTLFTSADMTSDSEPLSRALDQLNAEERNLLVLRIFEEKTFGEIGEIMNKSEDAIKKKYGRTKTKLKKIMEPLKEDHKCVSYKTEFKNKA
ncbi:RNA polymerase sigma factor [Paenibacillus polymyxa]|uniref:RNA polymerase sigma factor n=1 Tax=Paenibacillus polymyxa TaxID=1406 RepID=UPI0005CF58F7|nr:sigma-70 family RNA polymerase sigma factor [Paenibacillus polymyxa]KJD39590.1 DNA-directed RNA polymerase subunit sigma [Paenibacillus polymyxa]